MKEGSEVKLTGMTPSPHRAVMQRPHSSKMFQSSLDSQGINCEYMVPLMVQQLTLQSLLELYCASASHLQSREMLNGVNNPQYIKKTPAFFKRTTLFRLHHLLWLTQSWFQVSFSNHTLFPLELQAIKCKVPQASTTGFS